MVIRPPPACSASVVRALPFVSRIKSWAWMKIDPASPLEWVPLDDEINEKSARSSRRVDMSILPAAPGPSVLVVISAPSLNQTSSASIQISPPFPPVLKRTTSQVTLLEKQ